MNEIQNSRHRSRAPAAPPTTLTPQLIPHFARLTQNAFRRFRHSLIAHLREDVPKIFPIQYSVDEMPDLAHCIERSQPDPGNEIARWPINS
jgi:hypothetical protein